MDINGITETIIYQADRYGHISDVYGKPVIHRNDGTSEYDNVRIEDATHWAFYAPDVDSLLGWIHLFDINLKTGQVE